MSRPMVWPLTKMQEKDPAGVGLRLGNAQFGAGFSVVIRNYGVGGEARLEGMF